MILRLVPLILSTASLGAADIEVFHAQEIQPTRPAPQIETVHPASEFRRATNGPGINTRASNSSVSTAGGMTPFQAGSVKLNRPGGLDVVARPSALDAHLPGKWALNIPGVAYQTEHDRGSHVDRRLHTGAGASFGELTITKDGRYRWSRNGVSERGRLEQVQPRNTAHSELTYWRIHHGRESFYVFAPKAGELSVYSAVESFVAAGKPAR